MIKRNNLLLKTLPNLIIFYNLLIFLQFYYFLQNIILHIFRKARKYITLDGRVFFNMATMDFLGFIGDQRIEVFFIILDVFLLI